MRQRIAELWLKVPEPIRRLWGFIGWLEDHISRALLIGTILFFALPGGAGVIGYLSDASPLAIYVSVLAVIVLCMWGMIAATVVNRSGGLVALVSPQPSEPPVEKTEADKKEARDG